MPITKNDAEIQAEKIVKRISNDNKLISEVFQGIISKDESIRYPNAIALEKLSKTNPLLIYPEWNYFVDLLKSKNAFHCSIAVKTISNLTVVDDQKKFEQIFGEFFNLLDDAKVMVSRSLVLNSGIIVQFKPALKSKITNLLLSIDDTHHPSGRKDLIKGDIIEVLGEYFEEISDKKKIIDFVKKQLKSSSPSTVKKAKKFLSENIQ